MKWEEITVMICGIALIVTGIFLINYFLGSFNMVPEITKVPCYDGAYNAIEGLTCESRSYPGDRIFGGLVIMFLGIFIVGAVLSKR